MRDLLFDTPWWLLTIIGVVGFALLMSGNARQNKPLIRGGVGVLLLGILLAVVSYLVDTPKEKAIKGTHALVQAAVDRDKAKLNEILHPNASLASWNRQQIIDGATTYAERFGLKSATITGIQVQEQPGMIIVTIRVLARFQSRDVPYDTYPTDWELSWWDTGNGKWLLKDITPMGSGKNISGNEMSKRYFSGSP